MNVNAAALVAAVWLMDPTAADLFLRDVVEARVTIPKEDPHPMAIAPIDAQARLIGAQAMGNYGDPAQLPSVAIIRMEDMLSPWYADWKADQLREAYANESTMAIVVRMNCIGGVDQAAYLLTDVLAERNKPVVFHCQYGQMNSSAYWTACGGDYLMASRATDRIGGIGIYMPFLDSTGYYEKLGYAKRDIYAPESSEKNKEYRESQKGNDEPMEIWASEIRTNFWGYVTAQRGDKLTKKVGDPSKGGTFNATDALANGLIDEIGTFERAVQKAVELALAQADSGFQASVPRASAPQASAPTPVPNSTPTNTNTMNEFLGFLKMQGVAALKNVEADKVTAEMITAANADLKTQGIGFCLISETAFAAGVEAVNKVSELTTKLKTAQDALAIAQGEVARLGDQPGDTPTEPKGATDPAPTASGQPSAMDQINALPHMQALNNNPWFAE